MALGIILMLISGAVMTKAPLPKAFQYDVYQWHKSLGVILLLLLISRMIWRLNSFLKGEIPPLPLTFKPIEKHLAGAGHLGLYLAMIAIIFSGWLLVSSSPLNIPTVVFGWFTWPHLPGIPPSKSLEDLASNIHFFSASALLLLLIGHIGAVIKHQLFDQELLLARMSWWSSHEPKTSKKYFSLCWMGLLIFILLAIGVFLWLTLLTTTAETDRLVTKPNLETINTTESYPKEFNKADQIIIDKELQGETPPIAYNIDTLKSQIKFFATHDGNQVEGVFSAWSANVLFSPDSLNHSFFQASIQLDSAQTGDSTYDTTLKEEDWFSVDAYPVAQFKTHRIEQIVDETEEPNTQVSKASTKTASTKTTSTEKAAAGTRTPNRRYRAQGHLTLKGITQPVDFIFTLSPLEEAPVTANASFDINRFDFNIGTETDPSSEWVGEIIQIQLNITANPIN